MKYLHAMIRVSNLEESLHFYTQLLGLQVINEYHYPADEFSLYYLATDQDAPPIELTYNYDERSYSHGDNFGHLAFAVDNIYQTCHTLMEGAVTILRPPRDGRMAFVKDPSGISIELLQDGKALALQEPWISMENTGSW